MRVCLDTTCCFGYTHDLLEKWRAQIQKSLYQKWEHWISGYKKIASVSCDKKSHPFECNSQLAQRPHQLDGLPLCHFTFGSFFTFHPLCSKDYETRWLFSSQHLLLLKLVINVVGFKVKLASVSLSLYMTREYRFYCSSRSYILTLCLSRQSFSVSLSWWHFSSTLVVSRLLLRVMYEAE